jgi:hypothetical protein
MRKQVNDTYIQEIRQYITRHKAEEQTVVGILKHQDSDGLEVK